MAEPDQADRGGGIDPDGIRGRGCDTPSPCAATRLVLDVYTFARPVSSAVALVVAIGAIVAAGVAVLGLLAFPVLAQQDLSQRAERVALVIGNASYAQAPLRNPVNDARAMAKTLAGLGFRVSRLENATKAEMDQGIVEFESRLGPDTVGVFYYAGHGIQVRGHNYMIPIGASLESERHARIEAVDVALVTGAMEFARSRVNFIILDACRNNPFERRLRGQGQGLAAVDAASGTLIAYATAPGSVAEDGAGKNGLYTEALLAALEQPGLKAEEVFKRVRANVSDETGRRQVPWESSSLTGDFVFNLAAVPAPASAAAPAGDAETVFWNSIAHSGDPTELELYLEQYPGGAYAALARHRLAKLRGGEATPAPVVARTGSGAGPRDVVIAATGVDDVMELRLDGELVGRCRWSSNPGCSVSHATRLEGRHRVGFRLVNEVYDGFCMLAQCGKWAADMSIELQGRKVWSQSVSERNNEPGVKLDLTLDCDFDVGTCTPG